MSEVAKDVEIVVRQEFDGWNQWLDVYLISQGSHAAGVITMLPVAKGDRCPVACSISATAAQKLVDGLWACGIRPSEGTGSAGAMAAVQEHLKDMRRLVFDMPKEAK